MIGQPGIVRSAVLVSALVLVAAIAASPIDAAAKTPEILVTNGPINVTVSDPPPNHGSAFPVTVSGQLVYHNARLEGHKLKKGSKLAKSARARCPVGGATVPLLVSGGYHDGVLVKAFGSTVTDSSGAFSGVVQFDAGASGGEAPGSYQGGVPVEPISKKAGRIGGHPVRCVIAWNGLQGFSGPHLM